MISGKVIGSLETSARHPVLDGVFLLQVKTDEGDTVVAADLLRAPVGSRVLLCQGSAAQSLLGCACPVDAAITGIIRAETR